MAVATDGERPSKQTQDNNDALTDMSVSCVGGRHKTEGDNEEAMDGEECRRTPLINGAKEKLWGIYFIFLYIFTFKLTCVLLT